MSRLNVRPSPHRHKGGRSPFARRVGKIAAQEQQIAWMPRAILPTRIKRVGIAPAQQVRVLDQGPRNAHPTHIERARFSRR
jgi:hypothetical protein